MLTLHKHLPAFLQAWMCLPYCSHAQCFGSTSKSGKQCFFLFTSELRVSQKPAVADDLHFLRILAPALKSNSIGDSPLMWLC